MWNRTKLDSCYPKITYVLEGLMPAAVFTFVVFFKMSLFCRACSTSFGFHRTELLHALKITVKVLVKSKARRRFEVIAVAVGKRSHVKVDCRQLLQLFLMIWLLELFMFSFLIDIY